MRPVRVGDFSPVLPCSCGQAFFGVVASIYDYGAGGPALGFVTHDRKTGGCGSTRCIELCRRCGVRVEGDLELCRACSEEAVVTAARVA